MKDQIEPWHGGVPPGVPGAGWFIAILFVFSVVILSGWERGWWEPDHGTAAASHHTTGSGNKVQQ